MCRLERRYNQTMNILAWCHGEYTKAQLDRLTMPELSEVYNKIYSQRVIEMEAIQK